MKQIMKQILIFVFTVFALVIIQTPSVKAAWGDFDPSFGFQGVAVDLITGYHPRSVTVQPDAKILVTGDKMTILGSHGFFLRRYLSNGQLDTAFGKNGEAYSPELMFRGTAQLCQPKN